MTSTLRTPLYNLHLEDRAYIVNFQKEIVYTLTTNFESHAHQTNTNKNFAVIRSKGDQALFGKSTQAMKKQWQVPDNRPVADFAPTIILKAKDFATEITIFNAKEHLMTTKQAISQEQITNNEAVRKTLLERGIAPKITPCRRCEKS